MKRDDYQRGMNGARIEMARGKEPAMRRGRLIAKLTALSAMLAVTGFIWAGHILPALL